MNGKKMVYVLIYCLLLCVRFADGQSADDVRQLIETLKTNYSRNVRPVANKSEALTLHTNVFVISINGYDEVTESFTAILYIQVRWNDASIYWTPANYSNIQQIELFYDEVWVPPLLLVNPANRPSAIASQDWRWQQLMFLPDGTAIMNSNEKVHTSCSANVIAYPFDVQSCSSVYYAVGYSLSEIVIEADSSQLSLEYYFGSSTWDILEATQESTTTGYAYEWRITIKMKRRATFLVINTVLPILVLGLLKNIVYLLPAEEGERVSFSITVLLAISVFMTIVSDSLPRSSNPISLFTVYLLVELMLNLFVSVSVVLNLRLFYRTKQTPVSSRVDNVVRKWCSSCTRISEVEPGTTSKTELDQDDYKDIDGVINQRITQYTTIANKWFREIGQQSVRPCLLNPDS